MTTKYLTGNYPSGYQIQSGVYYLEITSSASVGGSGVLGTNKDHVDNEGIVHASGSYGMEMPYVTGSTQIGTIINGKSNTGAIIEGSVTGVLGDNIVLSNYSTIVGFGKTTGAGVALYGNASLINGSVTDTTALVKGAHNGVNSASVVTNFGTIVGVGLDGVSGAGAVTNGSAADRAAYIEGSRAGVFSRAVARQLTNFGLITGGYFGAYFTGGGRIVNRGTISDVGAGGEGVVLAGTTAILINGGYSDMTGLIEGFKAGVYTETDGAGLSTISNSGTIEATGAGGYGVLMDQGTLTNGNSALRGALIEGATGAEFDGSAIYLYNGGVIRGTASAGLVITGGDETIVNGSRQDRTALITGVGPCMVSGGGVDTIINYGSLSGLAITAQGCELEVAAHSSFGAGPVALAGDTVLELIGGKGTLGGLSGGDLTVSGSMARTAFDGFRTLQIGRVGPPIGKNAQFTLTGSGEIGTGETLVLLGRLTVLHDLTVTGKIDQFSTGVMALASHGTVELSGFLDAALTVSFRGSSSVLELTSPSQCSATVAGLPHHGKIDLVGIAADSAVLEAGDKLVISDQGEAVATLQLAGIFGTDTFTATSDGKGGTFIGVARPRAGAALPSAVAFAGAAASIGASGEMHGGISSREFNSRAILLAPPRAQMA